MATDNTNTATLPDSVDPDDVRFDDDHPDVLAYDISHTVTGTVAGEVCDYKKPFDPRSGRWYDDKDPWPDIDSTTIVTGHQIHCAYADCGGFSTVESEAEIKRRCPECGEPKLGRGQFDRSPSRQRQARRGVQNRLPELRDDFAVEMDRLTDAGVGTAAAMDYLMCSVGDTSVREWASARGVKETSVRRNMKRVATKIGETVQYTP